MNPPLVFLPEAEDDIAATFRSYQLERSGLGVRFKNALRATLDSIAVRPLAYAIYWRDVRTALLGRFPYVVYFRVEDDRILVIAVQHGRRSGRDWKRRA